ncbi:MAG: RsmB/NOP family class I SAM-dependent RNA methyltransferase [Chloroflexi bacterium]|nr:RsmB/NOP family class I SAM-dependent RNA methyltransferase [Chloroflexota bacterium]
MTSTKRRPQCEAAGLPPAGKLALAVAGEVIRKADRRHPADAVLRNELAARRHLTPETRSQISHALFAYYRWRGWLDEGTPLPDQLELALSLSERFADRPESFPTDDLRTRAIPRWVESEVEVSSGWLGALQTEPRLWLRARPGQGRALAQKLGDCRIAGAGPLGDAVEYRGRKDLFRTPEFHAGEFELQDIHSQIVGLLCRPQPGETWWDACAGEGGKTLHLSDLMENKGLIWASDRSAWRLRVLKRRAARARVFNYRAVDWDGAARLPTKTKFDGVLADAPCSGLGTWHRNPHARWTATPQDLKELAEAQLQLLAHIAPALKRGGRLIYAVCTLARTETVAVANRFSAAFPEFQPSLLAHPWKERADRSARLWFWPQDRGGNGMFVAAWVRKS